MIEIRLSVHEIVDFILRKGDLDNRVFNTSTMEEGSKIHSKYQKKKKDYLSEVQLSYSFPYDEYLYIISGRADGIFKKDNLVYIDEIKSSNVELEKFFNENKERHLGQAEIYALIYCLTYNLENIGVRLTYISQLNYKDKCFKEFKYNKKELEIKVYSYLEKYSQFLKILKKFKEKSFKSLKNLSFPFDEYRKGQKEMIALTRQNISNNEICFIDAPTGIGKSMCFLYGSLKEIIPSNIDKIFYLTAKNSGFNSALDAYSLLKKNGLKLKAVVINAKEKMCLNKKNIKACNPDSCPFARNYFTKFYDTITYALANYDLFSEKEIKRIAKKYEICPFEFSLDLANKSNLIICDYNYIFNPISCLERYSLNDSYKRSVVLVDEAHNLVSRGRDMYSASFNTLMVELAKKELKKTKEVKLKRNINKLLSYFDKFESIPFELNKPFLMPYIEEDLLKILNKFLELNKDIKKNETKKSSEHLDALALEIFKFVKIYEFYDPKIFRINLYKIKNIYYLRLVCLDASKFINASTYKNISTIFFSGTIKPINYYKRMILGNINFKDYVFEKTFKDEKFKVFLNKDLSIKYKDRNVSLERVKDLILTYVNSIMGNYLIFAPSFEYLELLKKNLKFDNDIDIIYQSKQMTNEEKEFFLNKFVDEPTRTTVGICVLGGTFSEGIDLPNNRLIGVVIIGIGLPSISYENQQLVDYFESNELSGFNYAYVYPGINKIMQSVGRVIRTESDIGTALLIDQRYSSSIYSFLFTDVWKNIKNIHSQTELSFEIKKFYKSF